MAIRMPTRFTAAGVPHRVRLVQKAPDGWSGGQVGEFHTHAAEVTILGRLSEMNQRQVLMHESLHALISAAGLDILFPETSDELLVSTLAPHLLVFLRENPRVVAYLTDRTAA